ncbi:MAG TPA: glycoside hydrolase family 3 C-terminal domain-containing protein [Terriglobales bacterium]
MRWVLLSAILLSAVLSFAQATTPSPAQAASEVSGAPFRNPALPIEDRVNDLVSRMTPEEKISQLAHTADAIPRLGIPEYDWWSEGLHGAARAGIATVFPQAIGLAATFNPTLLHDVGDVAATEFRAKYHEELRQKGYTTWYHGLTIWSPNINIFRDPRWGRGQETYGEDPFLTAELGAAFVKGLQGDDPKYLKTLATSKHFAVHSGPEPERHSMNVDVSPHDLEDTYLPAFRRTVEAGVGSIMCAYNAVDGKPACAQPTLLQEHLRDAWGFKGYVVSDCAAVTDIFRNHHYTQTMEQGVAAALKAGTDLVCGDPTTRVKVERDAFPVAVQQGLITEEDINRALRRLFTARMRLGMFDPPEMVPYASIPMSENDSEPHRQLALRVARESLVLLKNSKNMLPLSKKYKTIAVIGPNGDSLDALLGNYNGTPSNPVTVLAGVKKRFADSQVVFEEGSGLTGPTLKTIESAFLLTAEGSSEHGLTAEYFQGRELQGSAENRIDPQVDFAWDDGAVKNISVRWTGMLVPPETGDYEIGFTGDDGYRVWVDQQLVAEDWKIHRATTLTKTVHLEAGRRYPIKIEYFQAVRRGRARLIWHLAADEPRAINAAKKADLIIAVLGLTANLEGEEMEVNAEGFRGGDRTRIDLPAAQESLLKKLASTGKPLVLVLMNGSALAVNWADRHVKAILEVWYPGGEGGTAVAEALAGDFSPGGRLPVTFYKSVEQLPPFDNYNMKERTYRYFSGEPLYPFGYGLSYAKFEYSRISFDKNEAGAADSVTVSVDVKNAGKMPADEVVQVYLTHRNLPGAPIRSLAGFQRAALKPGETQTVSITVPNRELSVVNEAGERKILAGEVDVWVGGGQPVARPGLAKTSGVSGSFRVTGETTLAR